MKIAANAVRIARREMRGGLRGFRVFLACLALGVGAIAAVGSIASSVITGLEEDGAILLGGDAALRMTHRDIGAQERAWLERSADVSRVVYLRSMARRTDGSRRVLVEMKMVDSAYPLYGNLETSPSLAPEKLFGRENEIETLSKTYDVHEDEIVIQNLPLFYKYYYKIFSSEEPIAVFIKNTKPSTEFMTDKLAKKFEVREMFRWPINGRFSSHYGRRKHPIFRTRGFHNGTDIAVPHGRRVGAARGGRVISSGWMGGYGKVVIIAHPNGFRTLYGHLSRIYVRSGQKVCAGKLIGRVGSTGWSTGPHLHFTLWHNGRLVNPMKVLW